MTPLAAKKALAALLLTELDPAPIQVWRKSQTDCMNFIDQATSDDIGAQYKFPMVVIVTGQNVADTELSDSCADVRESIDLYYIRKRSLTTEEQGSYETIEEWGEDFALQMRTLLWTTWTSPITRDEPHMDSSTSNQVNQFLYGASRKLPFYAVGCGTSVVMSVT